jgi:DNA repair protein RecO (recombination protein O)
MGDMNRRVRLLSPELGLIDAVAYGVRKSGAKLSAVTQPFVTGRFFLYVHHGKGQYKIEDIKAAALHETLNRNLKTLYAASFFAEVILCSYAGGDEHKAMYDLITELLDILEADGMLDFVVIQGCWRLIRLLGIAPDLQHCALCGRELEAEAAALHSSDTGLVCGSCSAYQGPSSMITVDQRKYLLHTQELELARSLRITLGSQRAVELKRALIALIDHTADGRLKTVRSGLL